MANPTPNPTHLPLAGHELRQLSVLSVTHPQSICRYFAGRHVRSTTRIRVEQALREMGRADLVRAGGAA